MKLWKKTIAWLLTAATLMGSFGPAYIARAKESSKADDNSTEVVAAEDSLATANPDFLTSDLSPAESKVLVLDPGHCKKHTGAAGNGLKEEVVVVDIAKACRSVLDTYGDVTVYMTREDGTCCANLGVGECLGGRNNYAKRLDADFLISMHINAGSSNGANVLTAYKSGYHDNIRIETQAFGKEVLKQLKSIGIANKGLLLRKSASGSRYPNGKLADYYSIVRRGVVHNLPSVIIEHGFITSKSDCKKFFKTLAKRKKVGETDAKAIINYFGLEKPLITGSMKEENGNTYYVTEENKKVTGWVKSDGVWYYFDNKSGAMCKGFITVGENTFYLSPSTGQMQVGWFTVDDVRYFATGNGVIAKNKVAFDGVYNYLFDGNGKMLKKGFHTIDNKTYYVNSSKHVVTGIVKVSGKYYAFSTDTGERLYGYQNVNGKYYYLDPETGVMEKKKILQIDEKKYYFGSSGARTTGWVKIGKNKYYFNPSGGAMVTGWKKIRKKYYYFDKKTGIMQKKKWIGKYYVNSKGVRTKKKK